MALSPEQQTYTQVIKDLHATFEPHQGQVKIGRAILDGECRVVFVCCGRKFGKSTTATYLANRYALLKPKARIYIFAPTAKQAREIYWADGSLYNFVPSRYHKGKPNSQQMRVTFRNDSFIKLDGSEMHQQYRGIEADLVIYDEFKDFHPDFHIAMRPNLLVRRAPLLILGTPPENDVLPQGKIFIDLIAECKDRQDAYYVELPSWTNPHISREELENEKRILLARGEEDVWIREYEGRFVKGGHHSIFPMFKKEEVITPGGTIANLIRRDAHKLDYYCMTDPGTRTCWAWLFIAHDPRSGDVYFLDEIYEKDQEKNTVSQMWPRALEKMEMHYPFPERWEKRYDEQASWFYQELLSQTGIVFSPTRKQWARRESTEAKPGLSLCKDQLIFGKVYISDRCPNLVWEIESYIKDKNGQIPKLNDHCIDLWRYFNYASHYELSPPDGGKGRVRFSSIAKQDYEATEGPDLDFVETFETPSLDFLLEDSFIENYL